MLFGALVGAQVAYAYLPEHRLPAATRGIVCLLLATSTTEAVSARGARRGLALVGGAGAIGFATELAGVATGRPFGSYSYSDKLGSPIAGVPPLAAAAWAMMARPAWVVAGLIDGRPAVRIPVAAGALTAWDLFLDPRMAGDGYWSWPGGGRYEGVPASNFAGWFATALAVFTAFAALDRDDAPARDGRGAAAIYAWTWLGETFANAVIWRRPRVAAVGGAGMGAFALAALVRSRAELRSRPLLAALSSR